jgi:hypothetical protein
MGGATGMSRSALTLRVAETVISKVARTMSSNAVYLLHKIQCAPRRRSEVAAAIANSGLFGSGGDAPALYGIWRSQIGLPRDTLTMMSVWPDLAAANMEIGQFGLQTEFIHDFETQVMRPTLRPLTDAPPTKQGNYAFRWFKTPNEDYAEFLTLCETAWPSFEAQYDLQIIGLWACMPTDADSTTTLLLTRRPDLSVWERSKIPQTADEARTRAQLSRRYDLCDWTVVYTSTLITAADAEDGVRWS